MNSSLFAYKQQNEFIQCFYQQIKGKKNPHNLCEVFMQIKTSSKKKKLDCITTLVLGC